MFEVCHSEQFPNELGTAPKKVKNAYFKTVLHLLRENPNTPDSDRIKKLKGYKDLWRIKIAQDYRLVYRVDVGRQTVTMLILDHGHKAYERLGMNPSGEPGIRIVAKAEELVEREPTPEEKGIALIRLTEAESRPPPAAPANALPFPLTPELLSDWGVPDSLHELFAGVRTEGELLSLTKNVSDKWLKRVVDGIYPSKIEEILQQPVRKSENLDELGRAAEGARSLDSFLLDLDDEQKDFVARFSKSNPTGPWLLKGGPGSGKSVVALYCIRSLFSRADEQLPNMQQPRRVLFTTYTNSLVNASTYLLNSLGVDKGEHEVEVRTIDSLASSHAPREWREMKREDAQGSAPYLQKAIDACKRGNANFGFSPENLEFLLEEIEGVIVGRGLSSLDSYVNSDRAGRGRILGRRQREDVWKVWEQWQSGMREAKVCLWAELRQQAALNAKPKYDYVFIDEAQDLSPVSIRFCMALSRNPSHVLLTADMNQSIYGRGLSWAEVAKELRFQGRAKNLRRNYRATMEIWTAIKSFAPRSTDSDAETLDVTPVFKGPMPTLVRHSATADVAKRLNSFLHEALLEERTVPGGAEVLCRTNADTTRVASLIDSRLNPKAMKGKEVELGHRGVKVITMHSAKGLQFPVVAVMGVEASRNRTGTDPAEHLAAQQRLLFVACSRAMRRLIVFASRERPSSCLADIDEDAWETEELG